MAIIMNPGGIKLMRAPTYGLTKSTVSVDEGASVTFMFTTDAMDGIYYWNISGDVSPSDFVDNQASGSFSTSGGTAVITRVLKNDLLTEGLESLMFEIRRDSNSENTLISSSFVDVNDTSVTQYSLSVSADSVNEGSTATYTFTTTGPDGTFYWTNAGTTTASDFSDGINSGSFSITSGTGSVTRTVKLDQLTEGSETIVFQVRSGSYSGSVIASSSITANDTSLTAYSLNASTGSLGEGSSVTYTFTTTGPDGTFYWTNSGTTRAADFSDGFNSGSFIVTAGTGSVSRIVLADNLTEGNENIIFEIRSGSYAGSIISSTIVNVNDTSINTWTPLQLTNIRGWYKADTGLTLSGLNVNTWADQSGNGNNLVATAYSQSPFTTNPPAYNANGNPLGGASIDFTSDYMTMYNYTLGAASGSLTVVMIGKVTTWNSSGWLVGYFNSSSTNDNALSIINSSVTNKWQGVGGSSNTPVSSPTSLVTTDAVRIMRRNATSQQAIQNGAVEATTANLKSLPTTNGVLVLGARPAAIGTPNLASNFRVYEVIIMRSYITDSEVASLQTYATTKWGI